MNALLSSLPGWLDSARQKYHLPSISAAVTLGTQVIWKDACGCARLENGQPAAPDHVYPIGSVTKVFITTALMQMTEMGILGLNDPVVRYLPEYQIRSPFPGTPVTTLRQLASHTSGLPRDAAVNFPMNYSMGEWAFSGGQTPLRWYASSQEVLDSLVNVELELPPDTAKTYSNLGIFLLGVALSRACGQDVRDFIRQHIFEPLEMASAGWLDDGFTWQDPFPAGYACAVGGDHEGKLFLTPPWQLKCAVYSGGIYCTPTDLGKFLAAQFRQDGTPLQGRNLLCMRHPDAFGDTTIGWWKGRCAGYPNFGHAGAHIGFMTSALAIDELELGVVIASNRFTLFENHSTEIAQELLAYLAPAAVEKRKINFCPGEVDLSLYEGCYSLPGNVAQAVISQQGAQLRFRLNGVVSAEMVLVPLGPHQFGHPGAGFPTITFGCAPSGEITHLVYALFNFSKNRDIE